MNTIFADHVARIPLLFNELRRSPLLTVSNHGLRDDAGIYIFYAEDDPIHVGRTRNIRQRIRTHRTPNHNSASFAFKQARRELGRKTTYNKATSRAMLQAEEEFGACFKKHVESVSRMGLRFLAVSDPIDQYLLELYTVLEFGLGVDEFDTH